MKKSKIEEHNAAKQAREDEDRKRAANRYWWLTAPRPHMSRPGTRQNRRRRHARQGY